MKKANPVISTHQFHRWFFILTIALLMVPAGCRQATTPLSSPEPHSPEQAREARLEWWREARFGLFIHWGLYALPAGTWKDKVYKRGYSEWIMFNEKIPREEYAELAGQFNPGKFDPDAWVAIAKDAGMKYIVITAKHHDGFSLFESQVTEYDVVDATPFKRDIVKELEEACHRAGLHFGVYYSVDRDWYRPTGPGNRYNQTNTWDFPESTQEDFDRYVEDIALPQVKELITRYDIDLIWFDAIEMKSPEQVERIYHAIRESSPDTIINSRIWSPRFPEEIPPPFCDYISSGDNKILENAIDFDWENPGSMNTSYGYNRNDHHWVETGEIIRRLADIVSKGGNYLLNVGPTDEGLIPQPCVDRFLEVGKWMKVNGEAIYGARAWKASHSDTSVYFTTRGKAIYAICTDWPHDGILLKSFAPDPSPGLDILSVEILGSDQPVQWDQSNEGLRLTLSHPLPVTPAIAFRILTR